MRCEYKHGLVAIGAALLWWFNFIWFTDDKLLSFTIAGTQNAQNDHLTNTCGYSFLTFTLSSKTVHQHTSLAKRLSFWVARHLISSLHVA